MRKLLFLFFIFCSSVSFAQTGTFNTIRAYYGGVIGSQLRDPSAMFDIQSNLYGFLTPRMTTTERNAIVSPANGLMIYNTTTSTFNFYNGSAWGAIGSAGTVTSVAMTVPSFLSVAGSPVTTSGTLAVSLSGTALPVTNGGTGLTSYAIGDIIYASGATTLSKLPIGTASQQLRVNAGATALEYFTPASSGITVGTTTITSGTTGSIGMNIGGIYSESISYRAQQATPFSTAFGFEAHSNASFSGVNNTSVGYQAGKGLTTGQDNVFIGYLPSQINTGSYNTLVGSKAAGGTTSSYNTMIGYNAGIGSTPSNVIAIGANSGSYAGQQSIFIGNSTGTNAGSCTYSTVIGHSSNTGYGRATAIVIGYGLPSAQNTANNQGFLGSNDANGYISNWFFNGQTHTAPYSVTLNACSGSAANGALMTIQGGAGNGIDKNAGGLVLSSNTSSGTGTGTVIISTPNAGSAGASTNAVVTRLTINGTRITSTLPIKTAGYTVATLPTGSIGDIAYVTDALAPTYGAVVAAGGAAFAFLVFDGTNWTVH